MPSCLVCFPLACPQADVFSFGMCCYEIMHRYLVSRTIAQELVGGDYDQYAFLVGHGWGGHR